MAIDTSYGQTANIQLVIVFNEPSGVNFIPAYMVMTGFAETGEGGRKRITVTDQIGVANGTPKTDQAIYAGLPDELKPIFKAFHLAATATDVSA